MKLYHYTHLDQWPSIERGQSGGDVPGLHVRCPVARHYWPAFQTKALFGLLEPKPDQWIQSRLFPDIWDELMHKAGDTLLEIDSEGLEGNIRILDWGYKEGFWRKFTDGKYASPDELEAETKYFDTGVDLDEYLSDPAVRAEFSLPEVIITKDVPLSNLSFATDQSKLIAELSSWRGYVRDNMIYQIERIPALSALVLEQAGYDLVPVTVS